MAKKYLDYDGLLYFWQKLKAVFALVNHTHTKSQITDFPSSMAPTSHTHGNITNDGLLQTTDVAIANGDKLVVTDASSSNKIARTSVAFDGTTTTQALTKAGTFATFNNYTHPSYTARTGKPTANATPGFGETFTVSQITSDSQGHVTGATDRTITIPSTAATTTSSGLMSSTDKENLNNAILKTNIDLYYGASDRKLAIGSEEDEEEWATVTLPLASTTSPGLMSSDDKTKLNSAEANQNAFSNVKVGNTTIAADTTTDTITLVAGSNITLTSDATNDKITIAATSTSYTNEKLGQGYGTCATGDSTTEKAVVLQGYELVKGGIVVVKFSYGVPANATMNINSKGAKPIYYKGSAIKSGVIFQGDICTFIYDGTNYHLISQDTLSSDQVYVDDFSLTEVINNKINTNAKGAANGVCPLNSSSKIDSTYLPSYVDDVIEAYARSGQTALSQNWLATGSASGTVITPEASKIYVLMADSGDYAVNSQFRWSGSAYVKLADGGVSSIANTEIDTIVAS